MKRYLITSALPYINGVKHLGNLVGSILPADVWAKFLRQQGHEVLFICGTDEHGAPAELAASAAGLSPQAYCDRLYAEQKGHYEQFGVQFDFFGRSSSPCNVALTQAIFAQLEKNGYISEQVMHLYYDPKDNRFLPDRYVEGGCPHCGFERARGDQCDGCGALLDPEQLLSPRSALTGNREITLTETKHLFFDLPRAAPELEKWLETKEIWPDVVRGIAKKWINEGLEKRSITRDLSWGIAVPRKGYENKVFYVWFDAPNGYISISQDWARSLGQPDAWKRWWLYPQGASAFETCGDDVFFAEFMAKDNVAFHAIWWPATLFAAQMGLRQVDMIKGFCWLTYEGGKFSTSQQRGVFLDKALELFPADYWRYALMSRCPETSDADFSFESFAQVINKELADSLGNFVNRSLTLFHSVCGETMPFVLPEEKQDQVLRDALRSQVHLLREKLYAMRFRQALSELRGLWALGNAYMAEQEPWKLAKDNPEKAQIVLIHCMHMLRLFAIASFSIIPYTSRRIFYLLGLSEKELERIPLEDGLLLDAIPLGNPIGKPVRLFEKIDPEKVALLCAHYAGNSLP